ncbi:TylF/MycF/NovP-related O-methyltransferase [Vampirovibrio sp.]|uniref:TylF/MycF/NovP-related O-methyltransferase n=1 Tax=Vampirovibrio sp. TaxID=2717857 RepID=UPI0035935FE5
MPDIYGKSSHKLIDIRDNPAFSEKATAVRGHKRTLLYYDRLFFLYQALENRLSQIPSDQTVTIAEVGVYKGGGSYFLASLASEWFKNRVAMFSIDTFEGHDERDITTGEDGEHSAAGFNQTSYESVRAYLEPFPFVKVIQSRIQDCATETMGALSFDFVHLDMDIYQPTQFALDFFGPRMKPGAIILVDDYGFSSCPGAKRAVDEYAHQHAAQFAKLALMTGQCVLIKLTQT